ncbi:elongation of very long chain fatty acids protein 7-like protein [Leptotrombidium deliense]|uniref:Elongation of very long chain fatty acids protein n=1 Tax=Leptotrombidium deliense TaxID=299467 RepID=A0A443SE08_9ACAR|nr:elongation of very long chain fatty acids protein 7-like protein [Leptotrombidium deliense]
MSGGPWIVLLIIAFYLYFSIHLGPKLMKDRQAFSLIPLIRVYNLIMMLSNGVFFAIAAYYTNCGITSWGCHPIESKPADEAWLWKLGIIWYFLITKFVDLFETFFFVLRKKHSQLSTLHLFHHSIVPIDVWVGMKYSPSESACFFPFINSFVHTIMYLYYGLSTFESMKPFLWWKKYLTQLQILQLCLIALHCVHLVLLENCNIPKTLFAIYMPQAVLLAYLFIAFFTKTYRNNLKEKEKSS